ncbi:Acetyltransferase (GNAT) family protein [Paenibacillus sp. 1_12]|uniref:GNAT family N-acetyltransferase n=1 Tax=Paenibacillus sp. 1_12 TaxID=1566278 RepID=UPI0008E202EF|nr:GNAT family N-acetyltransferase [Paenibacillus sp. 1_12]SFL21174.1 Acetyltransferase (GNAT) family protein [Paenibacillus sp. 1_12]
MTIRLLESKDQTEVIQIMMEHPLQFPKFIIDKYPERWGGFLNPSSGSCQYYVAYNEVNTVMGHAGYIFNDEVGLYEIVGVAVKKDAQRQGIGKALINMICSRLNELNEKKVILYTLGHVGNEDTITFYRNIGFELINQELDFFRNGYHRVTLIKHLGN